MKSWFPFAEYEFYAYLSAGMLLIAAIDYSFGGSFLINRQSWTVAEVVFWIVIAYLIGHLVAGWSASFLDQFVGRRLFVSSSDMLLGLKAARTRERLLAALSGATEYRPMSPSLSSSILTKVATRVGSNVPNSIDGDAAFEAAFPLARTSPDTAARLDRFLNAYGLCRNVSFVSLIAVGLLAVAGLQQGDATCGWLSVAALILGLGMFGRFKKFHAAYAREVFRTFDRLADAP